VFLVKFGIVTLFPEMFGAITRYGVTGRAVKNGLLEVTCNNPRDYTRDAHRTVDDRPYGGGPGMVMRVEPLVEAITAAKQNTGSGGAEPKVVYLSPQGERFDQAKARQVADESALVIVAGRYEGIDERVVESVIDEEWSIGDYVLSGGELAAMVVMDSVARLIPGVLGHQDSAGEDSFVDGLLDCPHYTRPEHYEGRSVPDVLLSGNHEAIRKWRLKQSLGRTSERRPDLFEDKDLSAEEQKLLLAYRKETSTGGR
jgi:tRNA (guanine37-N1)-methyltransferase